MTASVHKPAIAPSYARSWQLVTAAEPARFDSAAGGAADALILDIEDGVPEAGKTAARDAVAEWLGRGNTAWIRMNDATTKHWDADLELLSTVPGLLGVMLAKVESGSQVEATAARLPVGTPILALIESAVGLEATPEIARAESVFRMAFGSGDFRRDTGMDASDLAMAYPRARLTITSRAANIAPPVDGPTPGANPDELRQACQITASMGMTGKLCLSSKHAGVINEALAPSPADAKWAAEVIERLGADGSRIRAGNERPQLAEALRIAERSEIFGIA